MQSRPRSPLAMLMLLAAFAPAALAQDRHRGPAPAPQSVAVPEEGTTLPMGSAGGRPTLEVMIDGKGPFTFIVDTGAHISVVDTKLQEELALPTSPGVRAAAPGGRPAPTIVVIDEMKIGDTVLGSMVGAVMPLSSLMGDPGAPRGVLSASSFPGNLVTFDYPAKRITIAKGALAQEDAKTTFGYTMQEPLPTVPIRVAGKEARVHLDTGSGYGLSLPTKYLQELPLVSEAQEVRKAKTLMGDFPVSSAKLKGTVELGQYTLAVTDVNFSDIGPAPHIATGNIGYEILKDFVVTLDSRNRLIRIARPS